MRVIVCGGRKYDNYDAVRNALYRACDVYNLWDEGKMLPRGLIIIHGGASGADSLADQWAVVNYVMFEEYKAKWDDLTAANAVVKTRRDGVLFNANAGLDRNHLMLNRGADLVVAFPGNRGTRHMRSIAEKAGVPVWQPALEPNPPELRA